MAVRAAELSYYPGIRACLFLPGQLISDPGRAGRTERLAPLAVSQETIDGPAVGLDITRFGEHRRTVGNLPCFRQVERNEGNAERHVFHRFHGRRLELKAGVHAKIRRCQVTEQLVFAKPSSEMHPVIKAQIASQRPCFLKALAGSYYRELAVASSYFVHDMINRSQQQIQPVLAPHYTHPAAQV